MSSILERLKQIASEKSDSDKPTVLTREDIRNVTGLTQGSDIKCYKTLLEKTLQERGINVEFAKRGFANKRKNPESSRTQVTEGLFIPLEELEKVEIKEGDCVKVEYKKPTTTIRKGKTISKPGTLIIEKIEGQEDRFIPSNQQDEENYLEEEETSEEEELFNA